MAGDGEGREKVRVGKVWEKVALALLLTFGPDTLVNQKGPAFAGPFCQWAILGSNQ